MKLPPIREFMNSPSEFHAFVIGCLEVLCPWRPRIPISPDYPFDIKREYHYYLAGRAAAVIAWIIIAKLIQVVFF
jgi:hypothetical protein